MSPRRVITRGMVTGCVLAAGLATSLAAQALQVTPTDCKSPKEPLGAMTAVAIVQFEVPSDGRLDSTTFSVISVDGATNPGFRSAALRQLVRCKLSTTPEAIPASTWVRQAMSVDSTTMKMTRAVVIEKPTEMIPVPTADAIDSLSPYALSSLDERPRRTGCKIPKGLYSGARTDPGAQGSYISAQYQIDRRGRVDPKSITFQNVHDAGAKSRAIKYYSSCKFVPGRVAGIAVATYMNVDTWFDAAGVPQDELKSPANMR